MIQRKRRRTQRAVAIRVNQIGRRKEKRGEEKKVADVNELSAFFVEHEVAEGEEGHVLQNDASAKVSNANRVRSIIKGDREHSVRDRSVLCLQTHRGIL